MKSLKKTLVLLVVLSMILSAVSPVFAFNDVISEDYAEQANKMGAFGVFAGDAEGNFKAEENITRAEMAVIIGKLMGLTANEADANKGYASNFSDVAAGDWYTGWVNLVAGRGIISGFPDGTFRPNEKVTQAQAVTMIVKALGWGVVVDQTGTWPANYITKASELRLFKNAVETNSELVTRGNVAIYCYNALTAKTWDVAESTGDELTSKASKEDTILAKYFSDFVNDEGDMKLIENAKVTLSGALTSAIGVNQVRLDASEAEFEGKSTDYKAANFLGVKASPKNKEEKTYGSNNTITAYVPANVADIASLDGKKVDVIFGRDNEVAYIVVTDDAYTNVLVTAWDNTEAEIEIDGETYEVKANAEVSVFGQDVTGTVAECAVCGKASGSCVGAAHTYADRAMTGAELINRLLVTDLACVNSKDNLTRNVVAEFIVNEDEEIESINFKFSIDKAVTGSAVVIDEYVVEKISSKNIVTAAGRTSKLDLEDLEEDDEPRVIRNGAIATLYDIEVGDVVTEITVGSKVATVIAVANTAEGTVTDYLSKTNTLEVDGENYVASTAIYYNEDGEVDKYQSTTKNGNDILGLFEDEEVTIYLNMAGEIVAVVGEAEATGTVLGVITKAGEADEDSDDVEYIKVKILAEDGSNKYYKVYNKKSGKNVTDAEYDADVQYKPADKLAEGHFAVGSLIRFEADADKVIKSDKVEFIADAKTYDFKSNDEVVVKKINTTTTASATVNGASTTVADFDAKFTVDSDAKIITLSGKDYRYSSSTVVINTTEEELISNWDVLTRADDKFVYTDANVVPESSSASYTSDIWFFVKGSKIVYMVAGINEDLYGASDAQYGILVEVNKDKDDEGDTIYLATVLVDGKEEVYECDSTVRNLDEGSFISFRVTDGEFKADPTVLIDVDFAEVIADLKDDATKVGFIDAAASAKNSEIDEPTFNTLVAASLVGGTFASPTASKTYEAIKVDSIETVDGDTYIVFEDTNAATIDLANDYIVYSLVEGELVDEICEGDYVLVFDYDTTDKDYSVVVVLN